MWRNGSWPPSADPPRNREHDRVRQVAAGDPVRRRGSGAPDRPPGVGDRVTVGPGSGATEVRALRRIAAAVGDRPCAARGPSPEPRAGQLPPRPRPRVSDRLQLGGPHDPTGPNVS
ncbi:hypothetical protein ACFPM0_15320 [Pseudonocardia sulfidoxydans]|uniref:hypothetical protein n=1 Tax=Pseudonocardia sulfidoxydans TaxID=54011 RepID=UPI00361A8D22